MKFGSSIVGSGHSTLSACVLDVWGEFCGCEGHCSWPGYRAVMVGIGWSG